MYVKVNSEISGDTYRSIVYGIVNSGCFTKYIVFNQKRDTFELVDYLSGRDPHVFLIQTNQDGFKEYTGSALLRFKNHCVKSGKNYPDPSVLFGYPDVCENYEFLYELLTTKMVKREKFPIQLIELPDANEWHYFSTQRDADAFISMFAGFHDSKIEKVVYSETDSGTREAIVTFDNSDWYGTVELCFEGVQLMKIVPAGENYSRELFEGSLFADENGVFWADDYMEKPDDSYAYSMIKALSCKWRKIG